MSTAVVPPSATPLPPLDRNPSPRSYPPLAPSASVPIERHSEISHPHEASRSVDRTPSDAGRNSPRSLRSDRNPKIVVKKEPPSSPLQPTARHRPRKLDLNTNTSAAGPGTGRPTGTPGTARDALGTMHDVGLACLSPGFQTHDPTMREQLQRSLSVRDQQRSIIESRLLKSAKGDSHDTSKPGETPTTAKPGSLSKKRPPPGLSIVPPAAERFANERVIQSAPLNQTFTGRNDHLPPSRQVSGHHMGPSTGIQHVPAIQTSNRLPPISDVFGASELNPGPSRPPFLHANSTPSHSHGPPMPSPSFPPQTAHPMSQHAQAYERPRDYRSAEDAVHDMTGGREDLQPRLVHYGGHQPPTPPSPHHHSHNLTPHKYQPAPPTAGRRRTRNEYEADSSPPLGNGREPRFGPFGEGRDSPATQKAKKEEFLSLCSKAWDLFHS